MTASARPLALVFSDLDGSLLDHFSYSYDAALPLLAILDQLEVPVILCTSKTRAEILNLREQLHNRHPFIVENGAAVFIPCDYFARQPDNTRVVGEYWLREFCPGRDQWLAILRRCEAEFAGEFEYFYQLGAAGIAAITGLDRAGAQLANLREYSEPVHWLGDANRKSEFISALQELGASTLQGGRFLAVSGACDKGTALSWLRDVYRSEYSQRTVLDLAIGDSGNDAAMLEVASSALLIRSPTHDMPVLDRVTGVIRSSAMGPEGWAEGLAEWLKAQHIIEI